MNKFLLAFAVAASLANVSFASAYTFADLQLSKSPGKPKQAPFLLKESIVGNEVDYFASAASENEISMDWGYCYGCSSAVPMPKGEFKGAIILTPDLATKFAGAVVSSISIGNPVDPASATLDYAHNEYVYSNPVKEVTVWLSEDINKEPFITATGALGERGFAWSTIELPETYTIEAGKKLVIGYTMNVPARPEGDPNADQYYYALTTDYTYPENTNSCMVYCNLSTFDSNGNPVFRGRKSWKNLGESIGNLSIRACLSGNMLPVNLVQPAGWETPQFMTPGKSGSIYAVLRNISATKVASVEYTVEIPGMDPQKSTIEFDTPLGYNDLSDTFAIPFVSTVKGNNIPLKAYVTAINGESVNLEQYAIEGSFLCISEGFPRHNVFEECTGTWCGWCVLGYAGMEHMADKYGNDFIGIGVHQGDPMASMDNGQAYEAFRSVVNGFPSAYLNRDFSNAIYPNPVKFEEAYEAALDLPAYATVSATVEDTDNPKVIKLNTVAKFAGTEESSNYQMAYTVIENKVGPYLQANYCSGMSEYCYGFEKLPESTLLVFNDVARNCSKPMGVSGSLPASIEENEEYDWSIEITLDGVENPKNVRVVAMIVNKSNGAIENAAMVEVPGYTGSVNELRDKEDVMCYGDKGCIRFRVGASEASVYTIDGRCVAKGISANLLTVPAGIYVVAIGNHTTKVMVR